jgi:hypothetical protein
MSRGGSATHNIAGTPSANLFDGTPSYVGFDKADLEANYPGGYVIEMTFHKDFSYSTKIGVSFGNTNWLARDIKIEIFDVSTGVYRTALETTTNTSQIVQVSTGGLAPSYAISKMRITFNGYVNAGFRIAQIWLLNYSSQGAKETLLGRDGGTLYGNLTAPTFIGNLTGNVAGNVTGNVQGDLFGGVPQIYSTTLGTAYNQTVQIREKGLNGLQELSMAAAPRLAFHWAGQVASSIAMESNGRIAIMNNPGTSYENLVARDIISSGGAFSGVGTGLTGTAAGLNVNHAITSAEAKNNDFFIRGVSPTINFVDTDQGQTRYVHHNGGSIGFLSNSGSWTLRIADGAGYMSGSLSATNFIGSGSDLTGYAPQLTVDYAKSSEVSTSVLKAFAGVAEGNLVYATMADNDQFRIRVGGTASNSGWVEFATADDGTEPIYFRQYTGLFTTVARTLTLLDGSGNTTLPGTITSTGFYQSSDIRLKDIISRNGDTIHFKWKDKRDELIHIGWSAQEIKKEYPDQVNEDELGALTVNYIEVLVAKIQDLENRLKKLEHGI